MFLTHSAPCYILAITNNSSSHVYFKTTLAKYKYVFRTVNKISLTVRGNRNGKHCGAISLLDTQVCVNEA